MLSAALVCGSLTGIAGPPFVTDDPEPVEYRHSEFYVASQHSKAADGWSGSPFQFELNYGAVSNVQLHLIAPLAHDAPSLDRSTRFQAYVAYQLTFGPPK